MGFGIPIGRFPDPLDGVCDNVYVAFLYQRADNDVPNTVVSKYNVYRKSIEEGVQGVNENQMSARIGGREAGKSSTASRPGGLSKHQGLLTLWGGDGEMVKETSSGHAGHDKSAPKSGQGSCSPSQPISSSDHVSFSMFIFTPRAMPVFLGHNQTRPYPRPNRISVSWRGRFEYLVLLIPIAIIPPLHSVILVNAVVLAGDSAVVPVRRVRRPIMQ
ncbi:hypothetical protein THAOC_00643 [Thalassiosira oceanica]|uniref:Uncharacterized protein n=1 Tax=Thalassiosira oceanica TaxID=159749 RepID=K0TFI7_THAOC|nr:hypothetical protein THAOC_00643 [Thalassiosira oceanica]|eukprot:EJK77523.1 hypothetical protein THAOC_00643 [Thalassiosira oceanica]